MTESEFYRGERPLEDLVKSMHLHNVAAFQQNEDFIDPRIAIPEFQKIGILADEFEEVEGQSEDEGLDDYKKGGYHPIYIGEILIGRYVMIQKLGWGHFSTVWLARDTKYQTYVAIKVQKSANHYLEAAFDEVEILQKAVKHSMDPKWLEDLKRYSFGKKKDFGRDDCHIVQLLNAFIYQGPYGKHFCMVFEILGVNLLEIIKRYEYKGIPLHICRRMSRQILLGLHYLHKYCGIIDTDLKPENVLMCLDKDELKEIYDKGQLTRNRKFEDRKKLIQTKIKLLNGEDIKNINIPDTPQNGDKEVVATDSQGQQDEDDDDEDNDITAEVPLSQISEEMSGIGSNYIRSEDDVTKELDRISKEKNLNKKERKNLKKKLKKKLKAWQSGARDSIDRSESLQERERTTDKDYLADFAKSGLREDFNIKIADLGNGCWTHHHFQPEIQTRQYRSPETILGVNYNETADIWSFGCMLFEMLTGEFLLDPKKNQNFRKSEDHLALMMELLNKFPRNFSTVGTNSRHYIDINGNLKKIQNNLNFLSLKDLFVKFHNIKDSEAAMLADFMIPMLRIDPRERASAADLLEHPWLQMNTKKLFADSSDIQESPEAYDKNILDKTSFHRVIDEEEFHVDTSFISSELEDQQEEEPEILDSFYDKETKFFDRSYKNVYVGYADGIDLNALDNTANWQFDKKVSA